MPIAFFALRKYGAASMEKLRRLFLDYPRLFAFICIVALAMKLAVPPGYMLAPDSKTFSVQICAGMGKTQTTIQISFDKENAGKGTHGETKGDTTQPCPFAGFSAPLITGTAPALLLLALFFIITAGLQYRPHCLPSAPRYTIPPLRGPPSPA